MEIVRKLLFCFIFAVNIFRFKGYDARTRTTKCSHHALNPILFGTKFAGASLVLRVSKNGSSSDILRWRFALYGQILGLLETNFDFHSGRAQQNCPYPTRFHPRNACKCWQKSTSKFVPNTIDPLPGRGEGRYALSLCFKDILWQDTWMEKWPW